MTRPDAEDVRLRFGMDPPRLEEQRHWEELVPGADEFHEREVARWAAFLAEVLPLPADDADGEA